MEVGIIRFLVVIAIVSAVIFSNGELATQQYKELPKYHVFAMPVISEKTQDSVPNSNEILWVVPAAFNLQAVGFSIVLLLTALLIHSRTQRFAAKFYQRLPSA